MTEVLPLLFGAIIGLFLFAPDIQRRLRRLRATPRALQLVERHEDRRKRACTQQPLCDPGDCAACDYDHASTRENTRPRDANHDDFCAAGLCAVCDRARQLDADWKTRQSRREVPPFVREVL